MLAVARWIVVMALASLPLRRDGYRVGANDAPFGLESPSSARILVITNAMHSLLLPEVAYEFSERTPRISAANLLQGALVRHGKGRLAVFGEAAMFSAQLAGPDRRPLGMNHPEAGENYRYALNVMHWLSGTLQ